MTREEAISLIKMAQLMLINPTTNEPVSDLHMALEMAIQALSQEPCDDTVSREAVLKIIEPLQLMEWLKYKVLELPSVNPQPCDDAISREDAEQMFRNIRSHLKPQDYKSAEEFNTRDLMLLNAEQMIHALPSVTHKSGKWIETEYHRWRCSVCREKGMSEWDNIHDARTNFYPDCGAKMESEEQE